MPFSFLGWAEMSQTCKVSCKHGAPMGRSSHGAVVPGQKVRLIELNIDRGGYDDGGCYWGLGKPLFMAWTGDGEYEWFIRANSRKEAAAELGITDILRRKE